MKNLLYIFLFSLVLPSITQAQSFEAEARIKLIEGAADYGLSSADVDEIRLTDYHQSLQSGTHHHYFTQEHEGIMIYNAVAGIHLLANGELLKSDSRFYSKIDEKINGSTPSISATQAVLSAAQSLGYNFGGELETIDQKIGKEQAVIFRNRTLSLTDVPVRLMYQAVEDGSIRLAWDFNIQEVNDINWWSIRVDATTGVILDKFNWVVQCNFSEGTKLTNYSDHNKLHEHGVSCDHSNKKPADRRQSVVLSGYRVYDLPIRAPDYGNRTLVANPEILEASPYGWHDTTGVAGAEFTTTRGNNTDAFEAGDNFGFRPNGGASLNFDFTVDTTYSSGTQSESASITNVFYHVNYNHDLWYLYGFDERSGNFQENNYDKGGIGSDYVNSRVQDGSGSCNSTFGTPADGSNPTYRAFTCAGRDAAYDADVITHEYGHGVHTRLTGGPSMAGCNSGSERMSEGWADYLSLMVTMKSSDAGPDARGWATWGLLSTPQQPNGPGVRSNPYSTNMTVNDHTYDDIKTQSIPHGVGSVWCAMLWEMTWGLIDEYGYNVDHDEPWNSGGNNLAIQLVMDGMKLQPCNPGFVDGRDAILAADMALTGGENQCIIWTAFAKRGLGEDADQGSSGSRFDGTEDFTIPGTFDLDKVVDATAAPGDTITHGITLFNNQATCDETLFNVFIQDALDANLTYIPNSASTSPSASGAIMEWLYPTITSSIVPTSILYDTKINAFMSLTDDYVTEDFEEQNIFENFTSSASDWTFNSSQAQSGNVSLFALDINSTSFQTLTLNDVIMPTGNTVLSFWHDYDTESSYDGGLVQASNNGGASWDDLGKHMIKNGYNSTINGSDGDQAFSGNSNGFIETQIDLRQYDGDSLLVRFVLSTDGSVSGSGWFVDLIRIDRDYIFTQANASENSHDYNMKSDHSATHVELPCAGLEVTTTTDAGIGSLRDIVACAPTGSTITFSSAIDGMPIKLTTGEISISGKELTFDGNGMDNTIIDGAVDSFSRIFLIGSGADVTFNDLTIQNGGSSSFTEAGAGIAISGGAIVELNACLIQNNQTSYIGAAIMMFNGSMTTTDCIFDGNKAGNGGVSWMQGGAIFTAENSVFRNNVSLNDGGVILNIDGVFTANQCLFYLNGAGNAGACVYTEGATAIANIRNCTATKNNSGGNSVFHHQSNATTNLSNNIIHGNNGAAAFRVTATNLNAYNNLVDIPGNISLGSNGNFIGNPSFVDAANNIFTIDDFSDAINAGINDSIPASLTGDFMGGTRIEGDTVDIGAFERSNNFCSGAYPIACGDVIEGNNANMNLINHNTCYNPNPRSTVWYEFQGTGDSIVVSTCGGITDFDTYLFIYEGDCDTLSCVTNNDQFCGNQSQLGFASDASKTYYIAMRGYGNSTGNYSLSLSCIKPCNIVVNTDDSGYGSLRYAVDCALAGDTIFFDPLINGDSIKISGSRIELDKDLIMQGNGATNTIIDGSLNATDKLFRCSAGTVTMQNLTIQHGGGASYSSVGGGIEVVGLPILNLINCVLANNQNSSVGGAIGMYSGTVSAINCEFTNNIATGAGSAIYSQGDSEVNVNQCFIHDNAGGQNALQLGTNDTLHTIVVTQSTIVNNDNTGILIGEANYIVKNNVFALNTGTTVVGNASYLSSSHNLVDNNPGSLPVDTFNNILADAQFVDAVNGDYHLTACSPGVNDGLNDGSQLASDFDGNSRNVSWDVDRGVYEYAGVACDTGSCANPIPIVCGQTYQGTNRRGENNIEGYPCRLNSGFSGPELIYEIDLVDTSALQILKTFQGGIDMFILTDCADSSTCLAWDQSDIIVNLLPGTYYLVIDGFVGTFDDVEFTVNCLAPCDPINLNPVCGDTVSYPGCYDNEYPNDDLKTFTFCPPSTDTASITFTYFDLELCCDQVEIFDNGLSLGSFGTMALGTTFTSAQPGTCMEVVFTSDGSVTETGFAFAANCLSSCPPTLAISGTPANGTFSADSLISSDGIILSGRNVTFSAPAIDFQANFEVELGAELETNATGCP